MADKACVDACTGAYGSCVGHCNDVLIKCLETAASPEAKQQCKERFKICMERCKEARETCIETCND